MKKTYILFVFVLIFVNFSLLLADECSNNRIIDEKISKECTIAGNKIYIKPHQLKIGNEGIFLLVQEEKFLIQQLNFDEDGIYCLVEFLSGEATNKCFNLHDIWCWSCRGCLVRYCKFRCKCVEWDF